MNVCAEREPPAWFDYGRQPPSLAVLDALQVLQQAVQRDMADNAMLVNAVPDAVVLPAPSARVSVDQSGPFSRDLHMTVRAGQVRVHLDYVRVPRPYQDAPPNSWEIFEVRTDVWGRDWSYHYPGAYVMDDFGLLVKVPS